MCSNLTDFLLHAGHQKWLWLKGIINSCRKICKMPGNKIKISLDFN